ncbi:hypothetical protein [Gracilibacillus xinjiangensis]|uniref:PEP-CTERM protein-sorting domain-containing protein n=1 Tax=Gracilibacillus xinjiangensis TaxID=1193282 RepID=A0ABV8WWI3_9BACI
MNVDTENIDRALFTAGFVGVIVFFLPETNSIVSILVAGIAAFVGFLLGSRLFTQKEKK